MHSEQAMAITYHTYCPGPITSHERHVNELAILAALHIVLPMAIKCRVQYVPVARLVLMKSAKRSTFRTWKIEGVASP